jgi:hypothetical protein
MPRVAAVIFATSGNTTAHLFEIAKMLLPLVFLSEFSSGPRSLHGLQTSRFFVTAKTNPETMQL